MRKILRRFINLIMGGNVTSESILKKHIEGGMEVGTGVRFFSRVPIGEPYLVSIGNNVTISTLVNFVTHDNSAIKIHTNGTDYVGKIVIGDNCFIGTGTIILPGVQLAKGTIVGAGSVVTKSVLEEHTVIAGNPAHKIANVFELREKYQTKVFDFRNMNYNEKKLYILQHPEKWLCR